MTEPPESSPDSEIPDPRTYSTLGVRIRKAAVQKALFGQRIDPVCIGRFEVRRRIGSGGIGVVYEAHDPELDRGVAIKVLRADPEGTRFGADRLRREAQAMARLSHANVVPVFEVGVHEGQTYLAMELVKGLTLRQWQRVPGRTWREIVAVYTQAGRGLAAAHRAGMVHRDFKPDNAIVGEDGVVRVLDFGLVGNAEVPTQTLGSRPRLDGATETSGSLTKTGTVLGTPAYMSPEQMAGLPTDARSDQFSFCVALWEALTGSRPYPGDTVVAIEEAMRAGTPPGHIETVPRRVESILRVGLSRLADDRHPDLESLIADLERGKSSALPKVLGATAVGMVAVGLAVGVALRPDPEPAPSVATEASPPTSAAAAADGAVVLTRGRRVAGPTWRAFAIAGRGWVLATDGTSTWWEDNDGSNRVSVDDVVPLTATGDGSQAVVVVPDGIAILDRQTGIVRRFNTLTTPNRGHVATGGHQLVYPRGDAVHTIDLETGEDTRRFGLADVELPGVDMAESLPYWQVVWSPDGQWLAVQAGHVVAGERRTRVIAMRPDGTEARLLSDSGPGPSEPCLAWLDQGIVFGERTWSAGSLYVQRVADGERGPRSRGDPHLVLRDESVQLTCYPASDSSSLVVAASPERASERQYVGEVGDDGALANVRPLAGRSTSSPVAWLDPEHYVVAARSGESRRLFRGSLNSTDLEPLFDEVRDAHALNVISWRPGREDASLFVWEEQPERLDLVRRDLKSGSPTMMIDWGRSAGLASGRAPMLACAPSGECILATRRESKGIALERLDTERGIRAPMLETELSGIVHWLDVGALSPDATTFAAAVYGPRIETVELATGTSASVEYTGALPLMRAQGVTYSSDGSRYWVTGRSKEFNVIWSVDSANGEWTEAYRASEDWFCSPRASPDDGHLAFTVLDIRATLWLARLDGA
ncbi:MAG: serine/threonine-protein kinase [Myxococcota bacterium]